jgi:receptor protein-tyrosine kinase
MSSEGKSPDLVRRAAARLSGAAERKAPPALDNNLVRAMEASIPPAPGAGIMREPAPGAALLRDEEPARDRSPHHSPTPPQGRHVNVSPTTLAANGISLPSAGFVRTVEEFRIIKRHILANASRSPVGPGSDFNRVIMITSAKPGDGKTYTAINLALSLAFERDLKVLLVDADVYRQSMCGYLGIKVDVGWTDLLSDTSLTFPDVLLHTNIPNLSVLPAGKSQSEVPELLSSRKMGYMVTEMARRYPDRFIIFDTLPCLASSEPAILAGMVGQTVFVVAAHETSRDQVESSLRLINACPSVSLILNKAEPMLTEQFGKYGYGYGYQYQK